MYDRAECEPLLSAEAVDGNEDDADSLVACVALFVAKQTFWTALESNNSRRPVQSHSRNSTTRTCSLENGNMQLKKREREKYCEKLSLVIRFNWIDHQHFSLGIEFYVYI